MKIVAALAWYWESPEFLTRCVESLAGIADHLVALDGPWAGFPYESTSSDLAEYAAIVHASMVADVPLSITTPGLAKSWQSQVAKRDALMKIAGEVGDWIFVIDGDEWINDAHADETRELLADTPLHVGTVAFQNVTGGNQAPSRIRRIYRPPVTVERNHHGYNRDGTWLHGPPHVGLAPTVDLPLELLHEQAHRGQTRDAASVDYRNWRRRTQAERWEQPDYQ